jgi:hypothetical protein
MPESTKALILVTSWLQSAMEVAARTLRPEPLRVVWQEVSNVVF